MASKNERLTIWYEEMDGNDVTFVGRKNGSLGEMTKVGIPVSAGFAITAYAMDRFIADTGIREQLSKMAAESDDVSYEIAKRASDASISLIQAKELPSHLQDAIVSDYRRLCEKSGVPECPIAVRPSTPVSMPGHMESYMNMRGERDLLDSVRRCWASAYNVEGIMHRMRNGMPFVFSIGVGISRMVNSRVSGVIFTINPVNGDPSKICIDGSWGLGEAIASGLVTPDTFSIDKVMMEPVKAIMGSKEVQYVYDGKGRGIVQVPVPEEKRSAPCLTRQELMELARIGKLIESHYGKACNIEFAIDADFPFPGNIVILEVKAESVWSRKEAVARTEQRKDALDRMVGVLIAGVKLEIEPAEHVHKPSAEGHKGCCPLCTLLSLGR